MKLFIKEFAKKTICDGHLFLMSGARKFYLMKPGVLVDPGFIKKHFANNQEFEFECVVDLGKKEQFKKLFKELQYLQFEKDLRLKSFEILKEFVGVFKGETHFLTFAEACYEEFCQIPIEDQLKMHETDMHLFRKALYASAFSIVSAMANDFYHFLMLKDFYNLTFSLDMGLCDLNYSYYVSEACNHENKIPGSGKDFLREEKATEEEMKVFFGHPQKSYDFLKKSEILSYPELTEVTLYQHELGSGKGFPRGILKSQVSSWEAIVIFSDSLVEITPDHPFETLVVSFLRDFNNEKLNELPVQRVKKKLLLAINHFDELKETGS